MCLFGLLSVIVVERSKGGSGCHRVQGIPPREEEKKRGKKTMQKEEPIDSPTQPRPHLSLFHPGSVQASTPCTTVAVSVPEAGASGRGRGVCWVASRPRVLAVKESAGLFIAKPWYQALNPPRTGRSRVRVQSCKVEKGYICIATACTHICKDRDIHLLELETQECSLPIPSIDATTAAPRSGKTKQDK